MSHRYSIAAITNDIFTKEDAEFLLRSGALNHDRICGVETGGCPHTAIRDDISMNQYALDEMVRLHPDLDILFVESGGDNLAATFSPELVDSHIYVIDVAAGDIEENNHHREVSRKPKKICHFPLFMLTSS